MLNYCFQNYNLVFFCLLLVHPGKYIDKTQLIELIAKASKIFPCRKRHRWHKLIRKKLFIFVNLYHWYVEENATNAFNQVSWFIIFKIITWVTNKLWYCSSSTLTLRPCSDSVVYERQRSERTVNYFITEVMPASAVISRIFMSSSCVMLTMPTCSLFTQFRWRLISNYFVSSQYLVTFRHYCDFSKSKKFKTMAHSKKIICLFDVDGTLTAPRKVTY